MKKILSSVYLALISSLSFAFEPSSCENLTFHDWKHCVAEHFSHEISAIDVEPLLEADLIERVIELDQRQPESTLSYKQYLKVVDLKAKIAEAKRYKKENLKLLKKVGDKYGVEPSAIVALIAMESHFGKIKGKFNLIPSLATLAFEGRRKSFFEKELFAAIQIYNDLPNELASQFKGSWAGAFGQCQFMPTTYMNYAVDYADKGYADLWSNKEDIYASVANYLHEIGWKKGENSVVRKKGARPKHCKEPRCPIGNKYLISIDFNGIMDANYMVGRNFNVLMQWNRSSYFGLATLEIVNSI